MGRIFTKIPASTFDDIQTEAGVLLKTFDPEHPAIAEGAQICATSGGISASCIPTFTDMGEDVDNCPNGMKELMHLDSWECKMSFTAIGATPEAIKTALGVADVSGTKVTPRMELKQDDFSDIWWVGDKANGGMVAIKLMNALSTGGFSLQTTKKGKGQLAVELSGHVSIDAQDVVPMEFYSTDSIAE